MFNYKRPFFCYEPKQLDYLHFLYVKNKNKHISTCKVIENNYMNFAAKLKKERKQKGYTQMDLARYMQVSQVSISYWERGIKEPSFEELIGLSKLFNKTTDYMLGVEE